MREIEAVSRPLPLQPTARGNAKLRFFRRCLFLEMDDGSKMVFGQHDLKRIGSIMPQVSDSRQQPKSLAHKLMEKRNQS